MGRGSRELKVVISGDASDLNRSLNRAGKGLDKFGKQTTMSGRLSSRGFSRVGLAASGAVAGVGALAAGGAYLVKQFEESQKVTKQTQAVLKSTGGAANLSAKAVASLATAISNKTGIDDEAIQSGENLLLTFTKVRDEAGRGNDVFSQATQTMTDMSAALGQDMKSSAIQLGKALNDPIKGVTALQRVGVSFTASQKDQIKTLVESGRTLDAQKLILRELNVEFGGSAAAKATPFDRLKVAAGNLAETLGGALAPTAERVAAAVAKFITQIQQGTGAGGRFRDILKGIGGVLAPIANFGKDAAGGIADFVKSLDDLSFLGMSFGESLSASIGGAVDDIDWSKIGDAVGKGVESALDFAGDMRASISQGLNDAFSSIDGRALAAGLLRVVGEALDALSDPSFWREHWADILTVAAAIIPIGRLLKIPGLKQVADFLGKRVGAGIRAAGGLLADAFRIVGSSAFKSFIDELSRAAPGVANVLSRIAKSGVQGITRLPRMLVAIAGRAVAGFLGRFGEGLGAIPGVVARVLVRADRTLNRWAGQLAQSAVRLAARILSAIDGKLGSLPSTVARWLLRTAARFAAWAPNFARSALRVGRGVVDGIIDGMANLPARLAKKVTGALGAIPGFVKNAAEKIGVRAKGDVVAGLAPIAAAMPFGGGGGGGGSVAGLAPIAQAGLSNIRTLFGPVQLNSGRRSSAANAAVGGAPNSDHLWGGAIDLQPAGGWTPAGVAQMDRIAAWARRAPMVRFIGWRGVPGHGPGDHLHIGFKRGRGDVTAATAGAIRGIGDVTSRGRRLGRSLNIPKPRARRRESVGRRVNRLLKAQMRPARSRSRRRGATAAISEAVDVAIGVEADDSAAQALIDAQLASAEAIRQQTEAMNELKREMAIQNAVATSAMGIGLREATRALADMISGEIVGRGYAGRALTAGAGSLARY